MAFERLEFTRSWMDPVDFPTYEPDENRVRADLQALHDETKDGFNRLVDQLNDPGAAAQLPFAPAAGLEAQNIQAAIEAVYAATREAAAGTIVNGTISKEKLTEDVRDRAYGGRVWVSMEAPSAVHHPGTGFPVGQQWLRPACTLTNLLGSAWTVTAGTAQMLPAGVRITGNGTKASVSAAQTLQAGQAGDRILLWVQPGTRDSRLQSLLISLNGTEQEVSAGMLETTALERGTVELSLTARWPMADYAVGSAELALTILNVSALCRLLEGVKEPADWAAFLQEQAPFAAKELPQVGWIQTAPGIWAQNQQQVLPVAMGGTGLTEAAPGALLCGGQDAMETVAVPQDGAWLQFRDGKPCWQTGNQLAALLQMPCVTQGTYTGNQTERTLHLPEAPVILVVAAEDQKESAVFLQNTGSQASFTTTTVNEEDRYMHYTAGAKLSGSTLQLWLQASADAKACGAAAQHLNRSGKVYRWAALVLHNGEE